MNAKNTIAFVLAVIVAAMTHSYIAGIVVFVVVLVIASKMPNEFQKVADEIAKAIDQAKQGKGKPFQRVQQSQQDNQSMSVAE